MQLGSNWRSLSFVGLEQAAGYPFQQWYVASAIGRQFKPILTPHWENIDPDKERFLLLGGGYEYLRTTRSGKVFNENRITFDATPNFRPASRLLLRDRNWLELRWINGTYSTTYRNEPSLEVDFRVHGIRFTPYGSAEFSTIAPSIPGTRNGTQQASSCRISAFSCWKPITGESTARRARRKLECGRNIATLFFQQ